MFNILIIVNKQNHAIVLLELVFSRHMVGSIKRIIVLVVSD